jgi:aminocarboxymuconate-semialdehyde decarboxylase
MVFSGIFDKLPNLKFVTHHAGGMIPFFAQRVKSSFDKVEMVLGEQYMHTPKLARPPLDYFKMFFYNDTALYGNTPALMCAHAFFGADRLLFGTDMPLGDSQLGFRNTKLTIDAIHQMSISDTDKNKIFEENAKHLLRLPL